MKNLFIRLLFISFLASDLATFGQSTNLVYKKKGKTTHRVVLSLTNDSGRKNLNPADFKKSKNLYFTATPDPTAKRQYFKENDITSYFTQISLEQDDNQVKQNSQPKQLTDEKGKVTSVVLSFPMENIKLYKAFYFVNKIDKSEPVTLRESFFPSFDKYKNIFGEAQELLSNKEYINAFGVLYQIEKEAQKNPEIKAYSFYSKATIDLPKQAIKNYTDTLYKVFLQKQDVFLKEKSKPSLDSCNAVLQVFNKGFTIFKPYLQIQKDGIPQLKARVLKIRDMMDSKYNTDKHTLKQSSMALLETGNYSNYKFYLFIDVLSRMLTHIDSLKIIDGITPLDLNVLNKFPEKTEELVNTGWFNDFKNLTGFLNDNIRDQKIIFNPAILSHLKQLNSTERQPYFEIFNAFNSLYSNPQVFYSNINRAIIKCTDSTLLRNMDTWLVSYKISHEKIDKKYVTEINRGIRQINNDQWAKAENTFNIIKRQISTIPAPWFYSAEIKFHQNEVFSAEAQFSKALELYPHYLSPRLFIFKSLLSEKRYSDLLTNADTAIFSFNIWYFHYNKAIALLHLKRYKDCINELLTQCISKNSWDLKQYYLLGDAYLHLWNFEKAKEAYMKTREIDPYSNSKYFNGKMKNLFKQQRLHIKKKSETIPASPKTEPN